LHAFSPNTSSKSAVFFKNRTFISRKATVWHSNQTNTVRKSVIWQKNHIFTLSRSTNGVHFWGNTLSQRPICHKICPMFLRHRVNNGQIRAATRRHGNIFYKNCVLLAGEQRKRGGVLEMVGPLPSGATGSGIIEGHHERNQWVGLGPTSTV